MGGGEIATDKNKSTLPPPAFAFAHTHKYKTGLRMPNVSLKGGKNPKWKKKEEGGN